MNDSNDFAALVRALRIHLGFTQERFAQELGVSFSTVNVWENGKRAPLPFLRRRLIELAKAEGLPTGGDSTPEPRRAGR